MAPAAVPDRRLMVGRDVCGSGVAGGGAPAGHTARFSTKGFHLDRLVRRESEDQNVVPSFIQMHARVGSRADG